MLPDSHELRLESGWVAELLRLAQLAPDIAQAVRGSGGLAGAAGVVWVRRARKGCGSVR